MKLLKKFLIAAAVVFSAMIMMSIAASATIEYYTVTFDANGVDGVSNMPESQYISQDAPIADRHATMPDPTNPPTTTAGLTFHHWSATNNGNAYDFTTTLDSNLTLYAIWYCSVTYGNL